MMPNFRPRSRGTRVRTSSIPEMKNGRYTGRMIPREQPMGRADMENLAGTLEIPSRAQANVERLEAELDRLNRKQAEFMLANEGRFDPAITVQMRRVQTSLDFQVARNANEPILEEERFDIDQMTPGLQSDGTPNRALQAQWRAEIDTHKQLEAERFIAAEAKRMGVPVDRAREIVSKAVDNEYARQTAALQIPRDGGD